MTIPDTSNTVHLKSFGETLRERTDVNGLLLRQAAAFLKDDTAVISELERNKRKASLEQVEKLATFLSTPQDELIAIWLAEKSLNNMNNELQGETALKLALKQYKQK